MSIDCILFDLDGTLLDTSYDFAYALNLTCQTYQHPQVNYQDLRSVISEGAQAMIELAFPDTPKDTLAIYKQTFLDFYAANIAKHTQIFPGLGLGMEILAKHHIPWGIVTNKPEYLTQALLNHIPFPSEPKTVISGDTLSESKPHRAPMDLAAQRCQIHNENCLYFGDHPRDIEAGINAEMQTAAVLFGYLPHNSDLLNTSQADFTFACPYDVSHFLQETFEQ